MSEAASKLENTSDDGRAVLAAFEPHEEFCRAMLDAYVLVDHTGMIVKANQLFSQLVGKKAKQILRTKAFDELLTLFINDKKLPIQKILESTTPTRIDEVRGRNYKVDNLNLIIGIYPFFDEDNKNFLGSFILIRDVTAETNLQAKYKSTALKSITDPLTGLYTRGYFEDYLNLQIGALKQLSQDAEQRNVTLALIDIDFFKKVNDVYGHQAGDFVLKAVSKIMIKTFRKTDVVCRYGGEEFLVILPTTDLNGASIAIEKLRSTVQNEVLSYEGIEIKITVSIGIAQIYIGKESYEETIARADEALYASKRHGRNRISTHNGSKISSVG